MIKETLDISEKISLALGYFDSVHKGHLTLINVLKEMSAKNNSKSAIATFTNNPSSLLSVFKPTVFSYDERKEIFDSLSLDYVLPFTFTQDFKSLSAKAFLELLFKNKIAGIVCGYDYRYGAGGEGDAESLKKEAQMRGVDCAIVKPVLLESKRVSTTDIIRLITEGHVDKANLELAVNFFIKSRVVKGFQRGREMGTPTINLEISCDKALPQVGVYATNTFVNGKKYKSVTNVGFKPTFCDSSFTIESFLSDYSGSLYNEIVKTEFVKKLRNTTKFASKEELASQINKDMNWTL